MLKSMLWQLDSIWLCVMNTREEDGEGGWETEEEEEKTKKGLQTKSPISTTQY